MAAYLAAFLGGVGRGMQRAAKLEAEVAVAEREAGVEQFKILQEQAKEAREAQLEQKQKEDDYRRGRVDAHTQKGAKAIATYDGPLEQQIEQIAGMPSPNFIGPPTKPSSVQIMPEEFRDQTAFDIIASGGKRYMIPAESSDSSSIHESIFMAELNSVQVRDGRPSELPHVGQIYKSVDKLERFYNSLGRDLTVDEQATLNRARVYRDEKIMGLQALAQNTIAARAREVGQNLTIDRVDKIPPQLNLLEAIPNLKESLLATGMPVEVINSQILAPALNYTLDGLDITKGGVSGQKYLIKMDDNNVGEVTKLVPVDPSVSEQDVDEIKSDVAAEGATPKQANDTAIAVVEAADAMAKNSELPIRPAEALKDAKFIRGQVGATGKPIEVAMDTATNSLIIRNNPMIETKGVSAALNGYFNDNLKDPRGLMTMRNLIAEQAKNDIGNIPEIA